MPMATNATSKKKKKNTTKETKLAQAHIHHRHKPTPPPDIHHRHKPTSTNTTSKKKKKKNTTRETKPNKPTSTKSIKPTYQIHRINYKIQQTASHPPNQANPHPKLPPSPSLMEVLLPATVTFTLEFLFVAKRVVISGELGGLCLLVWQDRRGEISDGEIGVVRSAMARGPEQREREM